MQENDNNNYEIIKGYFSVRRGEFLSSTDFEGKDFVAAGLYGYNSAMPANVPVICRIDNVSTEELLAAGYDAKTIKKCLSKNLPILKAKIAELEKHKMDNLRFYAQEKSSKQWRLT